jgi:penicillin-binding protein 1A
MLKLGASNVVEMAKNLGITTPLAPNNSLVLGSGEVSVLDMASAYSTFADKGTHIEPIAVTRVEDSTGKVLESFPTRQTPVLSQTEAAKISYALQQVVLYGTGTNAQIDRAAAGKTGTTDDNKDAWFVGYVPQLTAAVWMGYPGFNGQPVVPMENVHGETVAGGGLPAQIWAKFMRRALDGQDEQAFPDPGDLAEGKEFNPDLVAPSTVIDVPTPTAPSTNYDSSQTTVQQTAPPTTAPPVTAPPTQAVVPDSTAPAAQDPNAVAGAGPAQ